MSTSRLLRRATVLLAMTAAIATSIFVGAGAAQAAQTGQTGQAGQAGQAAQAAQATTSVQSNKIVVNIVPISHAGIKPAIAVSCGVAPPLVNDNFASGTLSWSAGVQCNTVLRLQGTTVLFVWGSTQAFQFGSQYDGNFSAASSSGSRGGIFSGLWGVNNNVLIFLPAGDTTNPSGGCVWFNAQHTQVKCTVTTGPIQAQ